MEQKEMNTPADARRRMLRHPVAEELVPNTVVQIDYGHKWAGCIGLVQAVHPKRVMLAIATPSTTPGATGNGNVDILYTYVSPEEIFIIGPAALGPIMR